MPAGEICSFLEVRGGPVTTGVFVSEVSCTMSFGRELGVGSGLYRSDRSEVALRDNQC